MKLNSEIENKIIFNFNKIDQYVILNKIVINVEIRNDYNLTILQNELQIVIQILIIPKNS